MANPLEEKSVKDILLEFFDNLENLQGVDSNVAATIKKLWEEENFNRDEILAALELLRNK